MKTSSLLLPLVLATPWLLTGCQQVESGRPDASAQLTVQANTIGEQVESKWTLRDDQAAAARSKLGLSSDDAEQRKVYFYDTRTLDLYRQGLILRARKVKHGDDDTTVKFRPMTSAQATKFLDLSGFKCEIDAAGTNRVSSCSLTDVPATGQIDAVHAGQLTLQKLFSPEQQAFAASRMAVNWSALQILGPTPAQVWKKSVSSLKSPCTVEQWTLPSGAVVTEVSMKTSQADAAKASAALKSYLTGKGLVVSTDQDSKTERTLSEWTRAS